ncbi:hypothetical protein O0544_07850 [Edwardsiella anguillarum]|nr:hypothetical protein [Edwardsiella anguillarum]
MAIYRISALTLLPGTFLYSYMAATLAQRGVTWQVSVELLLCGLLLFSITQAARRYTVTVSARYAIARICCQATEVVRGDKEDKNG